MKTKIVLYLAIITLLNIGTSTVKSSHPSYVIFKDGLSVYARNESTGQIELNGTAVYVIQAALDALPAFGGRIHIKTGIYIIDNTIRIKKSNVMMEGNGWGTVLMLQDNTNSDLIVNDAVDAKQNIEGIILSNFAIDGARTRQLSGGHGIRLNGNATYSVFSCLLQNLRIRYCFFAGIYASYTSEIHYSNLELGGNYNGLEIYCSSESHIENVIVSYGDLDGIQIVNSSDIIVNANCEFLNGCGILISKSDFNAIKAVLYHNRRHGIKLEHANGNIIEVVSRENSQEGDGLYDGINLSNSSKNIITNCIICGTNSTMRLRYGVAEEGKSDYNFLDKIIITDYVITSTRIIGSNTTYNTSIGTSWIIAAIAIAFIFIAVIIALMLFIIKHCRN